jgi:hypothetical protein
MVVAFVMVGEVVIKQLNPLPNDFLEEKRTKDRFINLYEIAQSDEKKSKKIFSQDNVSQLSFLQFDDQTMTGHS